MFSHRYSMKPFKSTYFEVYDAVKNNDQAALAALVGKKKSDKIHRIYSEALAGNSEAVDAYLSEIINASEFSEDKLIADELMAAVHEALEGYATAGNTEQVLRLLEKHRLKDFTPDAEMKCKIKINWDIIDFGYAKGGHVEIVKSRLAKGANVNAVLHGYAVAYDAELEEDDEDDKIELKKRAAILSEIQNLLANYKKADKNVVLFGSAAVGHVALVNELLAKGASKDIAVFAYASAGNEIATREMLKKGASIDIAIAGARFHSPNGTFVRRLQFDKQTQERNRRTILVILAAIFLTPLSLIFTLPLWYRAKENELLIEVAFTKEDEYEKVKAKRKAFRGTDEKVVDVNKPKKVWLDEKRCIFDKPQWERYSFFAGISRNDLHKEKKRQDYLFEINERKEESKKVVWGKF